MTGKYSVIDGSDDLILEMIRASASIPVFFNPVNVDDGRYVDGGVRNITPLDAAFDALAKNPPSDDQDYQDPDTIYVILASPLAEKPLDNPKQLDSGLEILKRSLGLLMNEVYRNDLKMAALINASLKYQQTCKFDGMSPPGGFPHSKYRFANLVLIQPEKQHLGTLEFDPGKIREAFTAGKERALAAVDEAAAKGGSNLDFSKI